MTVIKSKSIRVKALFYSISLSFIRFFLLLHVQLRKKESTQNNEQRGKEEQLIARMFDAKYVE